MDESGRKVEVKGERELLCRALKAFLARYEQVELVCDVGHFYMVHFIDLFGDAICDLPGNVSPAYWDYNQVLAASERVWVVEAFQMPR